MNKSLLLRIIVAKYFKYLADEIYSRFILFPPPLAMKRTEKIWAYEKQHKTTQKGIERVFGVLFPRYNVATFPRCLVHIEDGFSVMKESCMLHDMMEKNR